MVPERPLLKGRSEIRANLKESFIGRGDNKNIDQREPAEEVVFIGDYDAVRGMVMTILYSQTYQPTINGFKLSYKMAVYLNAIFFYIKTISSFPSQKT